ncbi:MAG: hypothetical protein IPN14_17095 [Bacteroidetes bacterium]|nr:hypothetical protein [Bacteroidota bacterium]
MTKNTLKNILTIFGIYLILTSCESKCTKNSISNVYCFIDVTDTINYQVAKTYFERKDKSESLLQQQLGQIFKFENCCGGLLRIYKINDVSENPFEELKYPTDGTFKPGQTEMQILSDPSVKKFKNEMYNRFEKITENEKLKTDNTKIYLPLSKALDDLSKSSAERKIVILFSDMIEHSSDFSFYKKRKKHLPIC